MGRNVVTAVAVVVVVGPRVAVVVTNELHLPLAGTLCRSLREEKCGTFRHTTEKESFTNLQECSCRVPE